MRKATPEEVIQAVGAGRLDSKNRRWFRCPAHMGKSATSAFLMSGGPENQVSSGVRFACMGGCTWQEVKDATIQLLGGDVDIPFTPRKTASQSEQQGKYPDYEPETSSGINYAQAAPNTNRWIEQFSEMTQRVLSNYAHSNVRGWQESRSAYASRHHATPETLKGMLGMIPPHTEFPIYHRQFKESKWLCAYMLRYPKRDSPPWSWRVLYPSGTKITVPERTIPPYSVFARPGVVSEHVWLVEGEGDAVTMSSTGRVVLAAGGASRLKTAARYASHLCMRYSKTLLILADFDQNPKGLRGAQRNVGKKAGIEAENFALREGLSQVHLEPSIVDRDFSDEINRHDVMVYEQAHGTIKDARDYATAYGIDALSERLLEIETAHKQ